MQLACPGPRSLQWVGPTHRPDPPGWGSCGAGGPRAGRPPRAALVVHAAALELAQQVKKYLVGGWGPGGCSGRAGRAVTLAPGQPQGGPAVPRGPPDTGLPGLGPRSGPSSLASLCPQHRSPPPPLPSAAALRLGLPQPPQTRHWCASRTGGHRHLPAASLCPQAPHRHSCLSPAVSHLCLCVRSWEPWRSAWCSPLSTKRTDKQVGERLDPPCSRGSSSAAPHSRCQGPASDPGGASPKGKEPDLEELRACVFHPSRTLDPFIKSPIGGHAQRTAQVGARTLGWGCH